MKTTRNYVLMLLLYIPLISWSQASSGWNYHRLLDYSGNINIAQESFCYDLLPKPKDVTANLKGVLLREKTFYLTNIGFGVRYYYVDWATNRHYDADENVNSPKFGRNNGTNPLEGQVSDICNSRSYKYHKVYMIGKSQSEAFTNFCNDKAIENTRWKLNINTRSPLKKGKVYQMDFGRGLNYYKIEIAANTRGDSDYDIDSSDTKLFDIDCSSTENLKIQINEVHNFFSECNNSETSCSRNDHFLYDKNGDYMSAQFSIRNLGTKLSQTAQFSVLIKNKNTGLSYKSTSGVQVNPIQPSFSGGYRLRFRYNDLKPTPPVGNYNIIYQLKRSGEILDERSFDFEIKKAPNRILTEQISIFNISGNSIKEATISSKEEEQAVIDQLPKGLYIIKNGDRTYKVNN